jgi:hypothetical protein
MVQRPKKSRCEAASTIFQHLAFPMKFQFGPEKHTGNPVLQQTSVMPWAYGYLGNMG